MSLLIYIARAVLLLRCCFSSTYRAETCARWKQAPAHRVIFEVGTGIIGLIFVGAVVAVIILTSRK